MLPELIHPVHLCLALGPVAVYLFLLGLLNLSSRPFVTNRARDAAALGIAISGLVIVGPFQLLLPSATVFHWGSLMWVLLTAFYILSLVLAVLLMRPRLVVYNISGDRMRPVIASLVKQLDNEARWAGGCVTMPNLGVQLHIESSPTMRTVQLIAAGPQQSYEGWRRLERALVAALRDTTGSRNPIGFSLVTSGLFLVCLMGVALAQDADTVAQSVQEIFQSDEEDP